MDYFDIPNTEVLDSIQDFTLVRSQALYRAIERNQFYDVIELRSYTLDDELKFECIIIDVECDQVLPNNNNGLLYRERLALIIPSNDRKLVEVSALRKDFPHLMHQNQAFEGVPKSLCLYFEPIQSVFREWTPEKFLRRIQWWIEQSSTGELHAADQPVEQLFLESPHELVLPWDFESSQDKQWAIFAKKDPYSSIYTFIVSENENNQHLSDIDLFFIDLTLPQITHGIIENTPRNMDELISVFEGRNVDLLTLLQDKLRPEAGANLMASTGGKQQCCIILLNVPISRRDDDQVEAYKRYVFFSDLDRINLGLKLNAIFQYPGRKEYFSSAGDMGLRKPDSEQLKPVTLDAVSLLYHNKQEDFRHQSGISESGPRGTFIGAGSLGSAILNLWSRCGWGSWTVVDKDHIKPHNLTRHLAYAIHIGDNKAYLQACLHDLAVAGSSSVFAIAGDAMDISNKDLQNSFSESDIVIDCTTTLEYPRLVSEHRDLPRHISVFVTPNGRNIVLLAEDQKREITLRSLEAQYYRSIITNDWGQSHLEGNAGTFWSGASCRDISVVMPYSALTFAGSILSEQIRLTHESSEAQVKIWSCNPSTFQTEHYSVPIAPEKEFPFGNFRLFIDEGLIAELHQMRQQRLPNETGGILLGYYDMNHSFVKIVAALPAPDDSTESPSGFSRGTQDVQNKIDDARARTAGIIQYIGEWHSHPPGCEASPSMHDLIQLKALAQGMSEDGLPAVQLIVGESDMSFLQASLQ